MLKGTGCSMRCRQQKPAAWLFRCLFWQGMKLAVWPARITTLFRWLGCDRWYALHVWRMLNSMGVGWLLPLLTLADECAGERREPHCNQNKGPDELPSEDPTQSDPKENGSQEEISTWSMVSWEESADDSFNEDDQTGTQKDDRPGTQPNELKSFR